MAKIALLIGVSEYGEGYTPLPAAVKDVAALQHVLQDHELGSFDKVETLINPEPQAMSDRIETLFIGCQRNDLLLFYFSGHGIKDNSGDLYLATRVTRKNSRDELIRSSAVPSAFVRQILHDSRVKRQVVILDCCFSGAFDPLRKDDGSVDIQGQLGAEGRVVLTSSSSIQYSLGQSDSDLSLYTRYLVEGIETGKSDFNQDGQITVRELHDYVFERVQATAPSMTPKICYTKDLGTDIILSKVKVTDPRLQYRKKVIEYAIGDTILPARRNVLDALRQQLRLSIKEADDIESEVFRPYRERIENLKKYRDSLLSEAEHEYPLGTAARDALKTLQRCLELRDEDIVLIEQEIEVQFTQSTEQISTEIEYEDEIHPTQAVKRVVAEVLPPEVDSSHPSSLSRSRTPSSRSRTPSSVEDFLTRGSEKYDAGDHRGAIADFDEAIRSGEIFGGFFKDLDSDGYEPSIVYYKRGLARAAAWQHQGAIQDYNQFIQKNSYSAKYSWKDDNPRDQTLFTAYYDCLLKRGDSKSHLDDKQGAIDDYTEAIRLKPNWAEAYHHLGNARYGSGLADKYNVNGVQEADVQEAIQYYTKAILFNPSFSAAYISRGKAKEALNDLKGAIADYTEAIRSNPDNAYAYTSRGSCKRKTKDRRGAIKDYDNAIRLEPDNKNWYQIRGSIKADLNDNRGAISDYTEVIRLTSNNDSNPTALYGLKFYNPLASTYESRGNAKSQLGDKQGAIADYREALKLYEADGNKEFSSYTLNRIEQLQKQPKNRNLLLATIFSILFIAGYNSIALSVNWSMYVPIYKASIERAKEEVAEQLGDFQISEIGQPDRFFERQSLEQQKYQVFYAENSEKANNFQHKLSTWVWAGAINFAIFSFMTFTWFPIYSIRLKIFNLTNFAILMILLIVVSSLFQTQADVLISNLFISTTSALMVSGLIHTLLISRLKNAFQISRLESRSEYIRFFCTAALGLISGSICTLLPQNAAIIVSINGIAAVILFLLSKHIHNTVQTYIRQI